MKTIDEVIERIEVWKGKNLSVSELTEGLTNRNYKVTVDNNISYVVRIPGEGSDLFINREVELYNTLAASDVGVGAHVERFFKEEYIVIVEFIQGQVMSVESFQDRERIIKAVKAIKKINTEAQFSSTFIMFDKCKQYYDLVKKHSIKIPVNFNEALKTVQEVEKKFVPSIPKLVSCHNDLLAENFIDMGDRMRIIDWELSGMNEPCFELGDFSVEHGFGVEEDALIVETYFSGFDERLFARMNIYKSMADILWTLWAVIQNHFSKLDFDYWEYGINRFTRAMNAVNSDNFVRWLTIA
jgi:thiamine kinase-like enzyme